MVVHGFLVVLIALIILVDFQTVVHHQLLQYHQLGLSGMNKSVEFGTHRKYDIGYIKVDKKIYMPTVERLNKWVDIVSKKSWYGKVEFYITGSFTSHVMNIKPFWPYLGYRYDYNTRK